MLEFMTRLAIVVSRFVGKVLVLVIVSYNGNRGTIFLETPIAFLRYIVELKPC